MNLYLFGAVTSVFILTLSITTGIILFKEDHPWTGILLPLLLILILTIGMPVYEVEVKEFNSREDIVVCNHADQVAVLYDKKRDNFKKVTDEYLVKNILDQEKVKIVRRETRPLFPIRFIFPVPNSIEVKRRS